MANSKPEDFLGCIKQTFEGEQGRKLLKYLYTDYVIPSSLGDTPEMTYYRLGQKELVQYLLEIAEVTPRELEKVEVLSTYEDYR